MAEDYPKGMMWRGSVRSGCSTFFTEDSIRKSDIRFHPPIRFLAFLLLLYLFFVSITMMGTAFKFFGRGFAETLLQTTSSPFLSLFVGILATSLVQSSSTVTSITVGLVAAGGLTIDGAISIVMGANIGTSITNTLVASGHIYNKEEFRRAFATSTVHDFFNVLAVIILFPLQLSTDFLGKASSYIAAEFKGIGGLELANPLQHIVKPAVSATVSVVGESGVILLLLSLLLLFVSLRYIVVNLKALVVGKIEAFFDKTLFKTGLRAFVVGIILTVLVQSSSITTSLVVPLAGAGILTLNQIFPFTLGANIGTTITAMLAALVTGQVAAVTVAFAHLLFNISGIVIIWPLKRIPIYLAETLARLSLRSKIIPFLYIGVVFFLIPLVLIYLMEWSNMPCLSSRS